MEAPTVPRDRTSWRKPTVIDPALVEVRLEQGPKANLVPLLARLLRRLRDRDQQHDAERRRQSGEGPQDDRR
jgi:hypothetical protein